MNMQLIQPTARSRETTDIRQSEKESSGDFLSMLKEQSKNRKDSTVKKTEKPAEKAEKKEPKADQKEAEVLSGQTNLDNPEELKNAEKPESGKDTEVLKAPEGESQVTFLTEPAYNLVFEELFTNSNTNDTNDTNEAAYRQAEPVSVLEVAEFKMTGQADGKLAEVMSDVQAMTNQTADLKTAVTDGEVTQMSALSLENRTKQPQLNDGLQSTKEADLSKQMQSSLVRAISNETSSESNEKGTENFNHNQEGKELSKWFSLDHGIRGNHSQKPGETVEKQGETSLEELQKKVEQQSFLPFERLIGAKLSGGAAAPVVNSKGVTDATPLPDQLRTGIEEGLSKQLSQFTIRLKPEGLGEILIHMTSTGGKVALSIGVSNMDTQKLLSSEMMHLKETLQPLNAEVQEIYHNSQGGMDMMNYQQGFFRNQQENSSGNVHRRMVRTGEEVDEEDILISDTLELHSGYGRLSAYI